MDADLESAPSTPNWLKDPTAEPSASTKNNSGSALPWMQRTAGTIPAETPAPTSTPEPATTAGPSWTQPAAQILQAAAVAQGKEAASGVKSGLDAEVSIPAKFKATISFLHVLSAFFIGLASVLNLMGSPAISQAIVCLYLFGFGILICGFEMGFGMRAISDAIDGNCGFIQHAAGRTAFLLLVGMLAFALGTWGIVGGSACFTAAGANMYAALAFQKCCKRSAPSEAAAASNATGGEQTQALRGYAGPGSTGFTASNSTVTNPVVQQAQPGDGSNQPWVAGGEDL